MRSFFLGFTLAWVAGLLAQAITKDIRWLILLLGLAALGLVWRQVRGPIICIICFLAFLGYVRSADVVAPDYNICGSSRHATVSRVMKGTPDTQRFIATLKPGECMVLVSTAPFPLVNLGDVIDIQGGQIRPSEKNKVSGYMEYLDRQGVRATLDFPRIAIVKHDAHWATRLADGTANAINRTFIEPEASLVNAMLLADERTLPPDIVKRFQHTGVSHILAISGSNISLLAIFLLALVWPTPLPAVVRTLIVVGCMWTYLFVIGLPVSALRAVIFWTLALLAYQGRRLTNLPSIITLAVLAMVTVSPAILQDVGFQLSVAAVAGIGLILFLVPQWPHSDLLVLVAQSFAITVGATVVTWPILAYHFHTLSLSGLLTNALIVPFAGFFMIAALITLLISFVVPSLAQVTSFSVHILWKAMDAITRLADNLPYGYFTNVTWPIVWIGLYYAALAALAIWWLRWQKRSWREIWA